MNYEQTTSGSLPIAILKRKAIIYVRQSTQAQVIGNIESQRRQYDLANKAKIYGFSDIEIIDDDLGISASGQALRPGFNKLVAKLCSGEVGAIFCLEISRLARNGREWHHILELCGLYETRVIDHDGIYDSSAPNDRLLLGMKGSISEFELGIIRTRMLEASRAKAQRGELRYTVPVGFSWDIQDGITLDPDSRVQNVIHLIFQKFRQLGSARKAFLWMVEERVHFPCPSNGTTMTSFEWRLVHYANVIKVLKNPFYAGAYAYGKTRIKKTLRDGKSAVLRKHRKPIEEWDVLIKDHHERYITWADYEENQTLLAKNSFSKKGGVKSGRGGDALLSGLLSCAKCGRLLRVGYRGQHSTPVYKCESSNLQLGSNRCLTFGGIGPDRLISQVILEAVSPIAIEAAINTEKQIKEARNERVKLIKLEIQQAQYKASLAERRYAACDPENRLIAAQLEKNWEEALVRLQASKMRLSENEKKQYPQVNCNHILNLSQELETVWNSPQTTMRTKQQLIRTLIEDIIANVDDVTGEIDLLVHWKGGRHTKLRAPKPGRATQMRTDSNTLEIIRDMTGNWTDEDIAACLNRMGKKTATGKTWTSLRIASIRNANGIPSPGAINKNSEYLTITQAAEKLEVTNHVIRCLIRQNILSATQVAPGAHYKIASKELSKDAVKQAIKDTGGPCRINHEDQLSIFSIT